MNKSESRQHKQRTKSTRQLKPQDRPRRYWLTARAKRIATLVVGVIGFSSAVVTLVVTFLSHLTVGSAGPIDPSSPYPISFTIANSSNFSLSNVQPMLGVCEIFYGEPKNLPERCNKILTCLDFTPWFAKKLAPDEALPSILMNFSM